MQLVSAITSVILLQKTGKIHRQMILSIGQFWIQNILKKLW